MQNHTELDILFCFIFRHQVHWCVGCHAQNASLLCPAWHLLECLGDNGIDSLAQLFCQYGSGMQQHVLWWWPIESCLERRELDCAVATSMAWETFMNCGQSSSLDDFCSKCHVRLRLSGWGANLLQPQVIQHSFGFQFWCWVTSPPRFLVWQHEQTYPKKMGQLSKLLAHTHIIICGGLCLHSIVNWGSPLPKIPHLSCSNCNQWYTHLWQPLSWIWLCHHDTWFCCTYHYCPNYGVAWIIVR